MAFKGLAKENDSQLTGCVDPWTNNLIILNLSCLVGEMGMGIFACRHQEDKIYNVNMHYEL